MRVGDGQECQASSTLSGAPCFDWFEEGVRQGEKGKTYAEQSIAAKVKSKLEALRENQRGEWRAHREGAALSEQPLWLLCQEGKQEPLAVQ